MYSRCVSAVLWLCLAILFVFLFVAGCDSNPSNSTNPREFSIHFSNFRTNDLPTWVILHSLDGSRVTSVKRVSSNETVSFGVLDTERVSFSIAHGNATEAAIDLQSFMNVPAGTWTIFWPHHPSSGEWISDTLGTASITLHYPPGYYHDILFEIPSQGYGWQNRPADSVLTDTIVVNHLDANNTMTIYAHVQNAETYYCGWLLNQPFQMHQLNTYTIDLNQPVQNRTVTCSRPIQGVALSAIFGQTNISYTMYHLYYEDWESSTVNVSYSDYPAHKLRLWVSNHVPHGYFQYYSLVDDIPATLAIPNGSINASYNSSIQTYENITVNGDADLLSFVWSDPQYNYWHVYTNPTTQSVSLPVIPDSIFAYLGVQRSDYIKDCMYLRDRDSAHDYDEYLAQDYKSTLPEWQRWNTQYETCIYLPDSKQQILDEERWQREGERKVTMHDKR